MNFISYVLVAVFLVVGISYMAWKKSVVAKLNNAMSNQDYDGVIALCQKKGTQRAIGKFNIDLYQLKATFSGRSLEEAHQLLLNVLKTTEKNEYKKDLLDIYYQLYLQKGLRNYCDELSPFIEEIDDDLFSTFCGWCYDVFLDEKTDYIVEMDQMIEDKKLTGVQLGVTAYMIARQYELQNDLENALSYYYTCIPCFHPDNMYVSRAKHKTNVIAEELGKETRV